MPCTRRHGHFKMKPKARGRNKKQEGVELCLGFFLFCQVQVLTYTVEPLKLFREMFRVLRPGAKISFLDWVQLPNFNESDVGHQELLRKVKPLLGAVWTPKVSDFIEPLKEAGFQILSSEEASRTGGQYALIEKARVFFEAAGMLLRAMTKIGLLPKHFETLFDRLTKDGEAFVEGDKLGLFTTSWQIIGQKPLDPTVAVLS